VSHVAESQSVALTESKSVALAKPKPVTIAQPVAFAQSESVAFAESQSVAFAEPESVASAAGGSAGLRAGATVQLCVKLPQLPERLVRHADLERQPFQSQFACYRYARLLYAGARTAGSLGTDAELL
jgi:hypothetical protein